MEKAVTTKKDQTTLKWILAALGSLSFGAIGFIASDAIDELSSTKGALYNHVTSEGHPVMVERVIDIRKDVEKVGDDIQDIKDRVDLNSDMLIEQRTILNRIDKKTEPD